MREKYFKSVNDELTGLIPQRKIVQTKSFANLNNLKNENLFQSSDYAYLSDTVARENKYYSESQSNNSRFCYISHQKKDGILAAKALFSELCDKAGSAVPVYNPQVDEKSITSYIKSPRLKSKAVELGFVEKKKIPLWNTVASVITGILLALNTLKDFFEITNSVGDSTISGFFGNVNFNIILTLLLIGVFAGSICSIIIQASKNEKILKAQLNNKLSEIEDDEFLEFLTEFNGNDFTIPDCKDAAVFICVLQNYSFKEKHILKQYWSNASSNQLWWIFAEGTNENEEFIIPVSQTSERRFYYQKPLSKGEKKKIAEITYAEKSQFSPLDDSGINIFGADYLCRFELKEREPIADINQLNDKISRFCKEYSVSYQTDIKLMIRLIADLYCTYGIDFTNRRNWQYLFDYNQGDSLLNELDKQATDALSLNNKTFRNLIPEIMSVFCEDLEEIVANHPNNEQTSEYEQWCIIKALKTRSDNNEECYSAICDTLMAEFSSCHDTPEDISSAPIWKNILIKTAEIFYKNQFFWFLPTVINNLLYFFGEKGTSAEKIFSQSIILEVARANLLLSINSESDNYSTAKIDPIRDHYRVVCAAAAESDKEINLDANSTVPPSFELLKFTNVERRRYYNALHFLKEQSVIEFLNYLFDIFCIVVSTSSNDVKFCYSVIYENTLYETYIKNLKISSPTDEDYIRIISLKILKLLDDNFGEKFSNIRESINELKLCLASNEETETVIDNILLLIVEFDILGFNTLNFISCMLARANSSKRLSKDIYLNLGSYLLGIIFLAYHEVSKASFYNEDFKYLVDICTSYQEPGGTVLGFMYYCDTKLKPMASANRIAEFISVHKASYLKNLNRIASKIKYSDIEDFFTFLACVSKCISEEEKHAIYEELERLIESEYMTSAKSNVYLELISLSLRKKSTSEFEKDTPRNNIEKFMDMSEDMVYLLYSQAVWCYGEEYVKLCHLVAPKILASNFTGSTGMVIICISQNMKTIMHSKEFVVTVRLVFEALEESYLENRITEIRLFIEFLGSLANFLKDRPELYSWTTEDEIMKRYRKLVYRLAELTEIQAQEFCALRKWSNYGIAIFLRELLHSDLYSANASEEYKKLGKAEKIDYIINHFKELRHIVTIDDKKYFNLPYIDMVTAFINNDGDIQHLLNEKECMGKLTNDLLELIKSHSVLDEFAKVRIQKLISDYIKHMD